MKPDTPDWIFTAQSQQLTIRWDDGVGASYTAVWLRDNCPEDLDPITGERRVELADQPEEPWIGEVFREGNAAISILWGDEEKTSVFNVFWLREQGGTRPYPVSPRQQPLVWEAEQSEDLVWMDYQELIGSKEAFAHWLRALAGYGIAFLRGVPPESGRVLEVARRIGAVRETHLGELFDARIAPAPHHTGGLPIGSHAHTGAPYHDPVPGLRFLHCLQSGPQPDENTFLDGYAVAACLREHFPDAYNILTWTPVRFVFRSAGEELTADRPLIQLDARGNPEAIHYDSRFIAPLRLSHEALPAFYAAYRLWSLLVRDPHFFCQPALLQGDLAVLDNRRTLHGWEPAAATESVTPHFQGCYAEMDGVLSRLAVLERLNADLKS